MPLFASVRMDDCKSVEEFREKMQAATKKGGMPMVFWNGEFLFAAVSPDRAREAICENVAQRWAANPTVVGDLLDRMQDEEPEDWND